MCAKGKFWLNLYTRLHGLDWSVSQLHKFFFYLSAENNAVRKCLNKGFANHVYPLKCGITPEIFWIFVPFRLTAIKVLVIVAVYTLQAEFLQTLKWPYVHRCLVDELQLHFASPFFDHNKHIHHSRNVEMWLWDESGAITIIMPNLYFGVQGTNLIYGVKWPIDFPLQHDQFNLYITVVEALMWFGGMITIRAIEGMSDRVWLRLHSPWRPLQR